MHFLPHILVTLVYSEGMKIEYMEKCAQRFSRGLMGLEWKARVLYEKGRGRGLSNILSYPLSHVIRKIKYLFREIYENIKF